MFLYVQTMKLVLKRSTKISCVAKVSVKRSAKDSVLILIVILLRSLYKMSQYSNKHVLLRVLVIGFVLLDCLGKIMGMTVTKKHGKIQI